MIYSVTNMSALIRSEMNESGTARISAVELLAALNDANNFVCTRGFCLLKEAALITTSGRQIYNWPCVRVNFIEYIGAYSYYAFSDLWFEDAYYTWTRSSGDSDSIQGIPRVPPTTIGYNVTVGSTPQYWFNWGKKIFIEPSPDAQYALKIYYADYPTTLVNNSDELATPKEFQRCTIDYAKALLSIKLKRWTDVGVFYNKAILDLQRAKLEYVKNNPEQRVAREFPDEVSNVENRNK